MAKRNPALITALRQTADRIAGGARYEWGHMGRCNCGHLVQTVTDMSEHAKDYCARTGHKVDDLFMALQNVGFSYQDVIHLENLSDSRVLARLPGGKRHLRRNQIGDVTLYMRTLADMLDEGATV
jgi:hypothetical protein